MCQDTPTRGLLLPTDPTAAGAARRFLREAHCATHHLGVLDQAQLLVSELVGNAVRHGLPPVELEVGCEDGDAMVVRVGDGSTTEPTPRALTDDEESGRGIALVDLLSDAWGVERTPVGKKVWFQLADHGR